MDELPSVGMLAEMFLLGLGVPAAVALAVLGLGVRFGPSVRQARASLVLGIGLARLRAARPGPLPMALLAVVAAAAGFVLVQAQIAKFAQLGGALAATLGAHALVAWRSPSGGVRGAAPGVAVLL